MGPGALWHRGALGSSSLRRDFWHESVHLKRSHSTWPLRFDPFGYVRIVGGTTQLAELYTLPCAVALLVSKAASLSRWRHAPLQEWADGLCPHACLPSGACRPAIPARREVGASQPPQVQRVQMLRLMCPSVKLSLMGSTLCTVTCEKWFPPVYLRCLLPSAAAMLSGFLIRSTSMSMRSVPQNSSPLKTMVGTPNTPSVSASSTMRSCSVRPGPFA